MSDIRHHTVRTNGIQMHVAEQGAGPLVVLLHGFPEGWYSWRHQLPALAAAGFRTVAPDQRGYGRTDRPEPIEAYDILNLTADVVGLVQALGCDDATVIGHDWGAVVAWHCALFRPDLFSALGLLSVPYLPRTWDEPRPTDVMRAISGDGQFYQLYFQEPGRAERELEADPRRTVRCMLYGASGDPAPGDRWRFVFGKDEGVLNSPEPGTLPAWLTDADVDYCAAEFARSGFRGPLNWYRNIDRMWEQTRWLCGAQIRQPTLFVAGAADPVVAMYRTAYDALPATVPNLKRNVLLPGAGHWVQQERAAEVNEQLVTFLRNLRLFA